jgi:hypothetical protein
MTRVTRQLLAVLWMLAAYAIPAAAQVDLSGVWVSREHEDYMERMPGPDAVEYWGIPLNADGRAMALAYSGSLLTLPERQCLYYTPHYLVAGPQGFRMWPDSDPVTGAIVAWNISGAVDRAPLKVWMDGRPRPSRNAPRTFAGFTLGEWRGDTLVAEMSHTKAGYLRRNGVPMSDEATMTWFFTRRGAYMTVTAIVDDPVYLTEPYIVNRTWELNPTGNVAAYPAPCEPGVESPGLAVGAVPHYLPGENPFVNDITMRYGIPTEFVLGGAQTLYPEAWKAMRSGYSRPERCLRYCCGWEGGLAALTLRDCVLREAVRPR